MLILQDSMSPLQDFSPLLWNFSPLLWNFNPLLQDSLSTAGLKAGEYEI